MAPVHNGMILMLAHVLQLYYSASVSCGAGQNLGGEFSDCDRWLVVGVWSAGGFPPPALNPPSS